MKKKLFLLLILIAGFVKGTPCHAQTEVDNDSLRHEFITLIANDPVINSLYIAVPINGEVYVITKNALRHFMRKGESFSPESMIKMIEDMLDGTSDIVWDIDDTYAKDVELKNCKYEEVPEVSEIAKKGKEYFINYYFRDNRVLKNSVVFGKEDINDVTQEDIEKASKVFPRKEKAIIYYLFQWRVPCRNACETGTLIIDYKDYNKF